MSHEQLISVQIKAVDWAAGKVLHLPCGRGGGRCAHAHLPGVSGEEEVTARLTSLPVQDSGKGLVSGAALCGSLNVSCKRQKSRFGWAHFVLGAAFPQAAGPRFWGGGGGVAKSRTVARGHPK